MRFYNGTKIGKLLELPFFSVFSCAVAVLSPQAVHLADIARRGEGVDFVLAEIFHQLGELIVGEQRLQFYRLFIGIASNNLIKGAATLEVVDDVTADAVIVLGNDSNALSLVEVGSEHIHH